MWRELITMWKNNNLLDQAWKQSFEMLEIAYEMFVEAMRVLRKSEDKEVKKQVREKDQIVNAYLQEVRRKVLTHAAVQGPDELPGSLVLVSIVIDIERVGDYTKNIVDLVTIRPETLSGFKFEKKLARIESGVKDNFIATINCLKNSDETVALQLLDEYEWINPLCEKCLKGIIKEKDQKVSPGDAASLALYFRWLKRINSHLRNITTSIVNPFDRIGFKPDQPSEDI
jgi:phosphate uptake regulator